MLTTLVVYVEDKSGVLNRVASLFRRRGFNIESITAGPTENPGVTRMTIVMDTDESGATRIAAHLCKLVNVLRVDNITNASAVIRDLAIIKVSVTSETRATVLQLAGVFRARVVDVAAGSLVLEATGTEEKIDGLVEVLRPYGITEMARTGRVALRRGVKSAKQDIEQEEQLAFN